MMGFISFENFLDDPAAVVTSPQTFSSTLPLANARTRPLSQVARAATLGATTTRFDIDLGSSKDIGVAGILGHSVHRQNSGTGYTFFRYSMRVRIWSDVAFSVLVWDSTTELVKCYYDIANEFPNYAMRLINNGGGVPNPIYGRFISIEFTTTGSFSEPVPAGFINDFGRLWVGRAARPDFSGQFKVGTIDQGTIDRSPGGQSLPQVGARLRQLECKVQITGFANALGGMRSTLFADVGSAKWTLQQIQARRGITGEVFVAVRDATFHDINNTGVYGTFVNNGMIAGHLFANYFEQPEFFTVLEER